MSTPGEGYGQQNQPGQGQSYGEPAYGAGSGPNPPGWGDPATPTAKPRNGAGIASLILGILSILLCWLGFVGVLFGAGTAFGLGAIPVVLGLLAIILGIAGLRRARQGVASNRAVSIIGLVLGILGLIAAIAITLTAALASTVVQPNVQELQQCISNAQGDPVALQQCQQRFSGQFQNLQNGVPQGDGG
ncbi:DUF4190 domain-containing protein [Actinomycetospora sp. CA-101289]|uniref:DUF4190 domain-containing protein n=1 Tax=Actinomycetospora sp. CA-101289 TaxID=3239893 RepID=UPI003D97FD32